MSFNPELLTLARESRGMTRAELAEAVGVSAGYLSKVENGLVTPSPRYITAMAGSLRYLPSLLTDPRRVTGIDSPCLYHRKRKTLPVKALRLVEAQMHMTRLQIRHLLADLDIETANSMHSLDPDEFGSPEKVAQALRRAWGIGPGPIRNLMQVIEDAGGVVVLADFGHGKLDGLSCWEKAGPPFFYLNTHKAPEILRFTLAHELGHLTMHFTPSADPEGEADRFAAEFLMPAAEIRGHLQGLQFAKLPTLKMHWRVSMKNLITRAARLGCINESRSRSLYVQLSQRGYVTEEPYPIQPEYPSILPDAMRVHVVNHGYALAEIADVLGIYEDEVIAKYGQEIPTSGIRALRPVQRRA